VQKFGADYSIARREWLISHISPKHGEIWGTQAFLVNAHPSGSMSNERSLRSYRAPWKGQLLLICRKCQKKLKHGGKKKSLAKLGKTLKKDRPQFHVIEVSCLKMCPKGAVTVCTQQQLARGECSIVGTGADVDALLEQFQ
jgi:hypothetical protein